jgi:O-antigen/teichoic acid export membrane protein
MTNSRPGETPAPAPTTETDDHHRGAVSEAAPLSRFERGRRLAARAPVPEGTFAVGGGLAIAGLATYAFQILAFRNLNKLDYGALNTLWVVVFVLAPGIFLPLEQEVGRAMAARKVHGLGGAPIVRRAGLLGGGFAILMTIAVLVIAFTTSFVHRSFAGHSGLVICLVIALYTFGIEYLARGAFAGTGHFGAYGVSMAAEALLRLAPCIPLALVGSKDPVWFGLCLAVPPLLATAIALKGQTGLMEPGPIAPYREISSNLGYLLGGSVFAQVLGYAPFIGAEALANGAHERNAVADFIVGLFLSRIPIVLFQAVQAALLPKLTALVSAGRSDEFRVGVRRLVYVVVGIGVLGVVAGWIAGPWAGHLLFGTKFNLGRNDVALLATGSGLFILALTMSQAIIALSGHALTMYAWLVGVATFVVTTAVAGHQLFLRVELGSIAGAAGSMVVMTWFYVRRVRKGVVAADLVTLIEQLGYEPLEI